MLLITNLNDLPPVPCGLTIGTFDGVHRGHQYLLSHLRSHLLPGELLAVVTFSTHPSDLFPPQVPLIYPTSQKVQLLFACGVDLILLLPFDEYLANLPFDTFLTLLKEKLPFRYLLLGEGARFGKGKQGDEAAVRALAPTLHFTVEYLPKQEPISSRAIRRLIEQGDFTQASLFLGRPYSPS